MSAATQMVAGGALLLLLSTMRGELAAFHPQTVSRAAWASLVYLIVVGSIIGFTAYLWLLHRESPTKVGTYAYVNPVVAVLLGSVAGGEPLGMRTALGTLLILMSVVVIRTMRKQPKA